MHRAIYNILLPRTGWHLIPFPPPQRVYGRTLRHNQIFSDGWFTKFSDPWCSAGALRAPERRYKNIQTHAYVEKWSIYAHFTRLEVEYRFIIKGIILVHFTDTDTRVKQDNKKFQNKIKSNIDF